MLPRRSYDYCTTCNCTTWRCSFGFLFATLLWFLEDLFRKSRQLVYFDASDDDTPFAWRLRDRKSMHEEFLGYFVSFFGFENLVVDARLLTSGFEFLLL